MMSYSESNTDEDPDEVRTTREIALEHASHVMNGLVQNGGFTRYQAEDATVEMSRVFEKYLREG